jgi:hypothetical protein
MKIIFYAIKKINPNAEFVLRDELNKFDNLDNVSIEWLNGTTPIPKADIEAQFPIVELDMAMKTLRAKRNKLLADTDYLALSDNTMTEEVRTYRQALRDITEGLTTKEQVEAVVFPTKP